MAYKLNPLLAAQLQEVLKIQEIDGTPSGTPHTLKFTNGSLTDNGDGTMSVSLAAGSGILEADAVSFYYRALGS